MYMNVNGIRAAQRPVGVWLVCLAGARGRPREAFAGRAGCGWRESQSLAGKGFPAAYSGPGLWGRVGRSLWLLAFMSAWHR